MKFRTYASTHPGGGQARGHVAAWRGAPGQRGEPCRSRRRSRAPTGPRISYPVVTSCQGFSARRMLPPCRQLRLSRQLPHALWIGWQSVLMRAGRTTSTQPDGLPPLSSPDVSHPHRRSLRWLRRTIVLAGRVSAGAPRPRPARGEHHDRVSVCRSETGAAARPPIVPRCARIGWWTEPSVTRTLSASVAFTVPAITPRLSRGGH